MIRGRKAVALLYIFFLTMLSASFCFTVTKAAANVFYIKPDGTVFPYTPLLERDPYWANPDVYKFTGDIAGSIIVQRDNIIIEGHGHTLQGSGSGYGIDISNRHHVEIANMRINFFSQGIVLNNSEHNSILDSQISYTDVAISLYNSESNSLANNHIFFNIVGIHMTNSDSNKVVQNQVYKNFEGIIIDSSRNCTISGNLASSNNMCGMSISFSENNTVSFNEASNNNEGINLQSSQANILECNIANFNTHGLILRSSDENKLGFNTAASNREYGVTILDSTGNVLAENSASNNTRNFKLEGSQDFHFDNSIDESNTVNEKPIIYALNVNGKVYDASTNAGAIYIINGRYITLKDLVLQNNEYGMFLWNITNSRIENNTASNNECGMLLQASENNFIALNNAVENNKGVKLQYSDKNIIRNNVVASNNGWGIILVSSEANTILFNTVSSNYRGVGLLRSNTTLLANNRILNNFNGIEFTNTSSSIVSSNDVNLNGWYGIRLAYSHQNHVTQNNITRSLIGIGLVQSNRNIIFHNNLINNTKQAEVTKVDLNDWDNGYASGGNYWTGHTRNDMCSGVFQNETGPDGIADSPYIINDINTDRYPLMDPWSQQLSAPRLRIEPSVHYASLVGETFSAKITIDELDKEWCLSYVDFKLKYDNNILEALDVIDGDFLKHVADQYPPVAWEGGDWTTYYSLVDIEPDYVRVIMRINHPPIWLRFYPENNGTLAIITFKAKAWPQAECPLELYDTILYEELDHENKIPHYAEDGYYRILVGDLDKNGDVDIRDLASVARSFGSYPSHKRWNAQVDINQDGKVDIRDIAIVSSCFGKKWIT